MSYPFFIARRIYSRQDGAGRVSRPAITIAIAGIAIGLAVMLVSLAIALGFKNEVRGKIIGFSSHIQVANYSRSETFESRPVAASDSLIESLRNVDSDIAHVQRFAIKAGLLTTDNSFQGILLKGVGEEFDTTFLARHLIAGSIPCFSDSVASGKVLISQTLANRLELGVGDKLYTYFIGKNVRARRFIVSGIFQTNFAEYDNRLLISDLYTARRLNNWHPDQVSGIELYLRPEADMEQVGQSVGSLVNRRVDAYGNSYLAQTIDQIYPSIFAWLEVLDTNVLVILILMTAVAGFTMISGLLILILERTNMIGILKSLGATDLSIRSIFLYFASFLIGKGMLYGNIVALIIYFVQTHFSLIHLDPATYYVDSVPMQLSLLPWLLVNIATLLVSILMLVGPSMLISRIKPAQSIRFE